MVAAHFLEKNRLPENSKNKKLKMEKRGIASKHISGQR